MIILLGSKNPSKRNSLEITLKELSIDNYEIMPVDAQSGVSSKPIGFEISRGVENRNKDLKKYALDNNIQYDYLCSLEGGFSYDENGTPFIVTYCMLENKNEEYSIGTSQGLMISNEMFKYVKNGYSLNKLIEELLNIVSNKESEGITGYLSNGIYKRDCFDKSAIMSAFISLINKEKYNILSEQISLKLKK